MPKGIAADVKDTLAKALKIGETFTAKELGVAYSTINGLISSEYVKVKGKREQEGRGRNPVEFAVTAKGKKAATAETVSA